MAYSEQEQLDRVGQLFEGRPRDRSWVLAQSSEFNPLDRKRRLPGEWMWPPELDECPGSETRRHVSREAVFAVARRAADSIDDHAALQLHVAVVVWGTETSAQSAIRALRPLKEERAAANLKAAIQKVRSQEPASVYRSMTHGGFLKTRGLEASYFTKFMYFAGYGAQRFIPSPLIYDQHVARALQYVTGDPWIPGNTSHEQYGEYLEMARLWAGDLNVEAPDVVERRLFHYGQQLKKEGLS